MGLVDSVPVCDRFIADHAFYRQMKSFPLDSAQELMRITMHKVMLKHECAASGESDHHNAIRERYYLSYDHYITITYHSTPASAM